MFILYQIQWDSACKAFPYRVVTLSGVSLAYFRDRRDAIAFCAGVLQ